MIDTVLLNRCSVRVLLLSVSFLILFAGGCGNNSSNNDSSNNNESADTDLDLSSLTQQAQTDENREESPWVGRWELMLCNQTRQTPLALLQIENRAGQLQVRMLDKPPIPELEKLDLAGVYFRKEGILVAFQAGENKFSFEGTIHGDVVLGSIFSDREVSPSPARMLKTSVLNMQGVDFQQVIEGTKQYEAALASTDAVASLNRFIDEHPDNPLIFLAIEKILDRAIAEKAPAKQVSEIAERMKKLASRWGANLTARIDIDIVEKTVGKPSYREITLGYFGELKKMVGQTPTDMVKKLLHEFQARVDLADADESKQKAGEAAIREILKENPFYLKLDITLAEYYEKKGEPEKALKIYSRLAALPGVASAARSVRTSSGEPADVVKKARTLWGGKEADFEAYLDEVYQKEIYFFIGKQKPEIELRQGRRVTFVELFTGSACQPCVAADIALGGVEKMLPVPDFIAVRYHQHIPGPDPLTVSPGEARFSYYSGRGTPLMAINGHPTGGELGGLLFSAQSHYEGLYSRINNLISQISLVSIDLQASLEKETLTIHAKAQGIPPLRRASRLRLLIVDPQIHYVARNGIRFHEMVVRDMPGGHEGVPVSGGKAELNVVRSLPKLQAEIIKGLRSLEENRGMKFDFLPPELKRLHVIAFVQDDASHEVLQSAISPLLTVSP